MPRLLRMTTVPMSLKYLIKDQMKYMSSNGFEVLMVSADGEEVREVVANEGVRHIVIPLTRQITPLQDIKCVWTLYRILRKYKPEIIHTHTPKAGIVGMLASWLARVPNRLHTVAGLPLQATSGNRRKLLEVIEKLTYSFATQVWPNSHSLYEFILQKKFTKSSKLKIIGKGSSNGIDVTEFSQYALEEEVLQEVKEQINYDESKTYLLFVGRLVKDKGIEELVKIFTQLQESYSDITLVLVGPEESELDPLSKTCKDEIKTNNGIVATGFSDRVKYFMSLSDLFIFPSHREGFPNVPMQAALMNCPVIASKITGNVDVIDHGMNGLLFQVGDEKELYKTVKFGLDNLKLMTSLNKNLKVKVLNNFDRQVIHKLILEEYYRCLSK